MLITKHVHKHMHMHMYTNFRSIRRIIRIMRLNVNFS